MTHIIDGKALALSVRAQLSKEINTLKTRGITPGLAVVLVGQDPASQMYVKNKKLACSKTGIESFSYELSNDTTEDELYELVLKLNADSKIDGILVQLPLPSHLNEQRILTAISPEKDVDGFHPENLGKLLRGEPCMEACTPAGIIALIDSTGTDISGKNAVVVGRSNIVGKPVSIMLLSRHATVTICHSKTKDLPAKIKGADILVAALGKPEFIKGDWIKERSIVIDVGTNHTKDRGLIGDVEFKEASLHAAAITPVPGGVGPMTIAMLLKNTVKSAMKRR
jgi:methylenetetrahydrofolate dehydrogenase (NADP+)/methenyltetrahydrofolate cyclohydrolase